MRSNQLSDWARPIVQIQQRKKSKKKKKTLSQKKNRVQIEMKGGGVQGIANEEGNTRAVRVCARGCACVRVCGCVSLCG